MNEKFYGIEVLNQDGSKQDLKEYEGKVLLIVNTATGCGFTPQYKELEAIYRELKDKGFEILDFPCNQFAEQAKGTDAEINQFCSLKYDTTFKRFKKVEVIGENKCDLFRYLTDNAPYKGKGLKMGLINKLSKAKDNEVRWNFTKFLIDREGNLVERFEPVDKMTDVKSKIENLLNK
ncbi:MAG: redoxin domain-containing protein [Acholeplasmatales bacterium]|nr:redoxin domain-containing protein [Acholeplasmatales bacterium]